MHFTLFCIPEQLDDRALVQKIGSVQDNWRSSPLKNSILTCLSAGLLLQLMSSQQARASVIVKERTVYYNVTGENGAALFRSIKRRGPKLGKSHHAIATTTSQISIKNVKTHVTRSKCSVKSVDVILEITYLYPRWEGKDRASPAVRKAWGRLIAGTRVHEQRHGQIAKDHAHAVDKIVRSMSRPVSRGCKNFVRGASKQFRRLASSVDRQHEQFDRRDSSIFSKSSRLRRALRRSR